MAERDYRNKPEYQGNQNSFCGIAAPKSEYLDKIAEMDDEALYKETKSKIWLSAYASNNERSDYHWQADVCYDEWSFREKGIEYQRAWEEVSQRN